MIEMHGPAGPASPRSLRAGGPGRGLAGLTAGSRSDHRGRPESIDPRRFDSSPIDPLQGEWTRAAGQGTTESVSCAGSMLRPSLRVGPARATRPEGPRRRPSIGPPPDWAYSPSMHQPPGPKDSESLYSESLYSESPSMHQPPSTDPPSMPMCRPCPRLGANAPSHTAVADPRPAAGRDSDTAAGRDSDAAAGGVRRIALSCSAQVRAAPTSTRMRRAERGERGHARAQRPGLTAPPEERCRRGQPPPARPTRTSRIRTCRASALLRLGWHCKGLGGPISPASPRCILCRPSPPPWTAAGDLPEGRATFAAGGLGRPGGCNARRLRLPSPRVPRLPSPRRDARRERRRPPALRRPSARRARETWPPPSANLQVGCA